MTWKRIVAAFAALSLLAAACSDDVDEAVDDLIDDDDDAEADSADDDTVDDDAEADPADDDVVADDAPVGVVFTAACVYLMHFPSSSFPDAPYHAILFTEADGMTATTPVSGSLPDREVATMVRDGGAQISWPVLAPGTFEMPTIIADGFAVDVEIVNTFLNGTRTYPAESSDVREELLEPTECSIPMA